jgi:hypothetical protein
MHEIKIFCLNYYILYVAPSLQFTQAIFVKNEYLEISKHLCEFTHQKNNNCLTPLSIIE